MYYSFVFDVDKSIADYLSKMNFDGITLDHYKKQVILIKSKLNMFGFDSHACCLDIMNQNLQLFVANTLDAETAFGILSVLNWVIDYPEIILYFDLLYRYFILNRCYDCIERMEAVFGNRIPSKTVVYTQHLNDISCLRDIYKVLNKNSKAIDNDRRNMFASVLRSYDFQDIPDFPVAIDLNIQPLISDMLEILYEGDASNKLEKSRFITTSLIIDQDEAVDALQSEFILGKLIFALE
eukprot:NODE_129_length_16972_cov_2.172643.p10 type:complete len:238 gc:universal NODE_129_length_16972_cov_2.172643:9609-8896(-)